MEGERMIKLYRVLEYLGGESKSHKKIVSYRITQKIKLFVLMYLIK